MNEESYDPLKVIENYHLDSKELLQTLENKINEADFDYAIKSSSSAKTDTDPTGWAKLAVSMAPSGENEKTSGLLSLIKVKDNAFRNPFTISLDNDQAVDAFVNRNTDYFKQKLLEVAKHHAPTFANSFNHDLAKPIATDGQLRVLDQSSYVTNEFLLQPEQITYLVSIVMSLDTKRLEAILPGRFSVFNSMSIFRTDAYRQAFSKYGELLKDKVPTRVAALANEDYKGYIHLADILRINDSIGLKAKSSFPVNSRALINSEQDFKVLLEIIQLKSLYPKELSGKLWKNRVDIDQAGFDAFLSSLDKTKTARLSVKTFGDLFNAPIHYHIDNHQIVVDRPKIAVPKTPSPENLVTKTLEPDLHDQLKPDRMAQTYDVAEELAGIINNAVTSQTFGSFSKDKLRLDNAWESAKNSGITKSNLKAPSMTFSLVNQQLFGSDALEAFQKLLSNGVNDKKIQTWFTGLAYFVNQNPSNEPTPLVLIKEEIQKFSLDPVSLFKKPALIQKVVGKFSTISSQQDKVQTLDYDQSK